MTQVSCQEEEAGENHLIVLECFKFELIIALQKSGKSYQINTYTFHQSLYEG